MIVDNIKNAGKYFGLSANIAKALKFLQENDMSSKEPGKYEIDGSNVFVLVQKYNSKPLSEGKWEVHRKYTDIQFVADGIEQLGYAYIGNMKPTTEYDPDGDILFLQGEGSMLTCGKGTFIIFEPDDAHMPGIAAGPSAPVSKLVFKVRVEAK